MARMDIAEWRKMSQEEKDVYMVNAINALRTKIDNVAAKLGGHVAPLEKQDNVDTNSAAVTGLANSMDDFEARTANEKFCFLEQESLVVLPTLSMDDFKAPIANEKFCFLEQESLVVLPNRLGGGECIGGEDQVTVKEMVNQVEPLEEERHVMLDQVEFLDQLCLKNGEMVNQVEPLVKERYVMVKNTMSPSCPLKDTTTPSCLVKDNMWVEDTNIMFRERYVPPWTCTMLVEDTMKGEKVPPWTCISRERRIDMCC